MASRAVAIIKIVCLYRGWDSESDIIDVFITFFFLSYTHVMNFTSLPHFSASIIEKLEPGYEVRELIHGQFQYFNHESYACYY